MIVIHWKEFFYEVSIKTLEALTQQTLTPINDTALCVKDIIDRLVGAYLWSEGVTQKGVSIKHP